MANPYSVPSVTRTMRILELLAQSQRGLTLSDISRRLAIPKSSAHVLIKTLETMGYLKSSQAASGRYCFGMKLVSLSNMALENLDLRELAPPLSSVANTPGSSYRASRHSGKLRGASD